VSCDNTMGIFDQETWAIARTARLVRQKLAAAAQVPDVVCILVYVATLTTLVEHFSKGPGAGREKATRVVKIETAETTTSRIT
jgi:hypothetical protein